MLTRAGPAGHPGSPSALVRSPIGAQLFETRPSAGTTAIAVQQTAPLRYRGHRAGLTTQVPLPEKPCRCCPIPRKVLTVKQFALWCAGHRVTVVAVWVALIAALAGGVLTAGSAFTDSTNIPDSESGTAYGLLAQQAGCYRGVRGVGHDRLAFRRGHHRLRRGPPGRERHAGADRAVCRASVLSTIPTLGPALTHIRV